MAHRGRQNADERLAAELAAGNTVRDAALAAGVGERTAHRRLTDPTFNARVREIRAAATTTAAARLVAGMTAAADVLRALLGSADEHVRHKAAVKVIDLGLKVCELTDMLERIGELEKRLASQQPVYRGPPPNQRLEDVE